VERSFRPSMAGGHHPSHLGRCTDGAFCSWRQGHTASSPVSSLSAAARTERGAGRLSRGLQDRLNPQQGRYHLHPDHHSSREGGWSAVTFFSRKTAYTPKKLIPSGFVITRLRRVCPATPGAGQCRVLTDLAGPLGFRVNWPAACVPPRTPTGRIEDRSDSRIPFPRRPQSSRPPVSSRRDQE